ncbi:MAG: glycosyltransferase [Candidatus Aenigmatarchaeota archaeon]
MKILFSAENFYPHIGGAEVFLEELMNELSNEHEIYVLYVGQMKKSSLNLLPKPRSFVFKNIPIFNRSIIRQYSANLIWKRHLEKKVKEIKPDLVFTQLEYTPSTIEVAKKSGIKSVVFLHNYDHFCPFSFRTVSPDSCDRKCLSCSPLQYKLQHPFIKKYISWQEKSLGNADMILSNSTYMAGMLRRFYGLDSKVFYPILNIDMFKTKSGSYTTFINPTTIKGASIALDIVDSLPDKRFLVVGGNKKWAAKFKKHQNVDYISYVSDMRDVYGKTKMLLVPSIWPEPFGRVALEAGVSGIPCVGSNRGGIPEAIGNGGLVVRDIFDIEEWIKNILKLDEKKSYSRLSLNAKKHANRFTKNNQLKLLKKLIGV